MIQQQRKPDYDEPALQHTSQNSLLPKSTNSDFLALPPNTHATNPHERHCNQVSYSSLKHLSTAVLSLC